MNRPDFVNGRVLFHKGLRNSFLLIVLLVALFSVPIGPAQAAPLLTTPTLDGSIGSVEYGSHVNGENQQISGGTTWYMTWDATNLYVGISAANVSEAAVLYLDVNPLAAVNGGANANGNLAGFNKYDETSFSSLPFRADMVVYFKNDYREYRTADGLGAWSAQTSGFGNYADNTSNVRELAIPWSAVPGGVQPAQFAWFGYVTSSGGFVYGQVPSANGSGTIGLTAVYNNFYFVNSTSAFSFFRQGYAQDFNTLANTGTANTWTDGTTLPAWYAMINGATLSTYQAGTGTGTAGAVYSFGTSASTERAMGSTASNSSGALLYGYRFTNTTSLPIRSFEIAYVGEQWRNGGNTTAQKLDFAYQVNATGGLNAGTWTDVDALDFTGPIATGTAAALDGNAIANSLTRTQIVTISVNPGESITFRFYDTNDANSDHGLAVDSFSVMPVFYYPCQATPNDGTTVYASSDASAVRNAVAAAMGGSTVKVAGTCAGVSAQNSTTQTVYIDQSLTLAGGYSPDNWTTSYPVTQPTVLDAQNGGRVIRATVNFTAADLTVQNGSYTGANGGGIYAPSLQLVNVKVLSNTTTSSGGGLAVDSSATITGSLFRNNRSSSYGGGLYAFMNGTLSIDNSQFISNTSAEGGAMALDGGTQLLQLQNSQILTNTAGNGGGIASYAAVVNVNNSSFNANLGSGSGGALAQMGGTLNVTTTRFVDNRAAGAGAIYSSGTSWFVNNLFARNSGNVGNSQVLYLANTSHILHNTLVSPTLVTGPAIYVDGPGTVNITNTIVASYSVGINHAYGTVKENFNLFSGVGSPYAGTVVKGGNSITGSVKFYDTTAYTLSATSAAIDAASATGPAADYFGNARPQGVRADIGYYETAQTFTRTLQLSSAAYSAEEHMGGIVVTATLDAPLTLPVDFIVETTDDTASASIDYTALSDILTFNPDTTLMTFTVPVTDDILAEGNEDLLLGISMPDNAQLGAVDTAILTIVEDHYLITPTAGLNGSIAPSGAQSVSEGLSSVFTITPDSGYRIASLWVDGASVGVSSVYTFEGVTANHTITAAFALNTSTTSLSSSPSPSAYGDTVYFTATVTGGDGGTPTGSVIFYDNGTPFGSSSLVDGQGTHSAANLIVGSHTITASYSGNYPSSESSSLVYVVAQAPLTVTASNAAKVYGAANPTFSLTYDGFKLSDDADSLTTKPTAATTATVETPAGLYSITVSGGASSNYTFSYVPGTLTISKAVLTVTADNKTKKLNAPLPALTAGYSGFVAGDDESVLTGAPALETSALQSSPLGDYPITVTQGTLAADNYTFNFVNGTLSIVSQSPATVTILSDDPDPSVISQGYMVVYTVTGEIGMPTGDVTVTDGLASCTATVAEGQCALSSSTAGVKTLTATYGGDANFAGDTDTASHTVNKITTTTSLQALPNPSTSGQEVVFSVSVVPSIGTTPTGDVVLTIDGVTHTITIDATGMGSYSTSALTVGSHNVSAVYSGDNDFATSTATPLTQTVNQAASTTTLESSANPSTYGETVVFSATVASGAGTPTGNVTFTVDGVDHVVALSGGVATYSTSSLSTGSHNVAAVYGGDNDFAGSTATPLTQVVNQAASTTTLESSANPSTYGQTVVFTATVASTAGTPTGNVTITVDGVDHVVALSNGEATYSASSLPAGSHNAAVVYGGDDNFAGSTATPLAQVVDKAASTTTLTSSGNPSVFGIPVTFTVQVASTAGTPTGNVTITVDGVDHVVALSGGAATYSTSSLAVGSHPVSAVYGGDSNFAGSSNLLSQQVNVTGAVLTILSHLPNPSTVGQAVTVTYAVTSTGGTPTGNVVVTDGTASCMSSVAAGQCVLTFTTVGTKVLTATYGGDLNFGSTNATTSHTVNKAGTTVTILGDLPDPSTVGQAVTVTFAVTPAVAGLGAPTGNVTVTDGSVSCTAAVAAGQCVLTFPSAGAKSLTATYGGDAVYNGSTSSTASHTVDKAGTTVVILSDEPDASAVGQAVTVTFAVTPAVVGLGAPTGNVTVTDGSVSCTAAVAAGQCVLTFPSAGSRNLTATYGGDTVYNGSTSNVAVHMVEKTGTTVAILSDLPDPSLAGQAVTVTYEVMSVVGGLVTPTGNVTVTDGSVSCTASVAAGQCVLIFLSAGTKTLTATYSGDAVYLGSSDTVTHQVNPAVTPGISVMPASLSVKEGGLTATVQVVLLGAPTAPVTINWATDGKTTITPTAVVFTVANWNITQTLTVAAVDDALVEGAHSGTITGTITSADAGYQALTINPLTVAIADNDYRIYLPVVQRKSTSK